MRWLKAIVREFRAGMNVLFWTWRAGRQGDRMKCYTDEPEHRKGSKIALVIALVFLAAVMIVSIWKG